MATYKVIQDIEAEDKLVGPLSLRQFLYAGIVVVSGFIAFKLAVVAWWLVIPFLPHMILFAVLAAPFGRDQPSEIWLLAKIRFFLKPRKRIWDQSGVKELVTITVPKRIEKHLTDNLSQTEVRSRLKALANTIDSRGWAVKNVSANLFVQPAYGVAMGGSDRLVSPGMLPQEVLNYDVNSTDDILDERANPTAQNLDRLIDASTQGHRQQLVAQMQQAAAPQQAPQAQGQAPADYWFMNANNGQAPQAPAGYATFDHNPLVTPQAPSQVASNIPSSGSGLDEQALLSQIKANKNRPDPMHSHLKTILPLSAQKAAAPKPAPTQPPRSKPTAAPSIAVTNLAANNDLNVATLARQANKAQELDGEVIINLH